MLPVSRWLNYMYSSFIASVVDVEAWQLRSNIKAFDEFTLMQIS